MALITTAAVVAAGATAAAIAKKHAADKAAHAQKKAIGQQENILRKKLDPGALNRLAQQMDAERAKNRLELQKEVDPQIAQLREFSKNQLVKYLEQPEETRQTTQVANQLVKENLQPNADMERLKSTIIERAQSDFDAGATLPPEFQAELVRTGLNTGGGAGVGVSKTAVGGVTSRLLGGAGISLKQQRAQEGAALAGTADALARSRQQLLANIFPTVAAKESAELQRAGAGLQLSEATLPESGLSGLQGVGVEVARQKGFANLLGQRGQVKAGQAQAQGEFTASLIGAGTSAATAGVGAIGAIGAPGAGAPVAGGVLGSQGGAIAGGQLGASPVDYAQLNNTILARPSYQSQYGLQY